jgi:asparagine N-glycosylation enzyme membrane subunit Stt3
MAQIILNTSFDTDLTGLIWTNAVYGVSLVLLSLSFLLPMVFRLGTIKANGFVRIVFIAVVLGSVMIGYLLDFLMSLISLETLNQLVAVAPCPGELDLSSFGDCPGLF